MYIRLLCNSGNFTSVTVNKSILYSCRFLKIVHRYGLQIDEVYFILSQTKVEFELDIELISLSYLQIISNPPDQD